MFSYVPVIDFSCSVGQVLYEPTIYVRNKIKETDIIPHGKPTLLCMKLDIWGVHCMD